MSHEIVLVRPGFNHRAESHWGGAPPLGLGILAASLRGEGLDAVVVDGKLEGHVGAGKTVERVRALSPRVVGISTMTVEFPLAGEIARRLKGNGKTPLVVLGGSHANALPERCLAEYPDIDLVLTGEAESSLAGLIRSADPASIPGAFIRTGDSVSNPAGPPHPVEPERIPFPAWDLFPRGHVYPVMTERGCPFNCVFCSHNLSRTVRSRPLDHVVEEIEQVIRDFRPREINIEDETFGLDPERTEALLRSLASLNRDRRVFFKAQTRVDRLNADNLRLMREAGFRFLELGVESGDPEVLARSGKGITLARVERTVEQARKAGIRVWLKFILGLPGETEASIRRSIDLAVRLNPDRISVARIVAYPGSRIYDWAQRGANGYRMLAPPGEWRMFDKYLGDCLELEGLDSMTLRRFQARMFLETYGKNLRLGELARICWSARRAAPDLMRKLLPLHGKLR